MYFRFPFALLFLSFRIYAQDYCLYNSIHGFCVTVDANKENAECHALDGWLQFYPADPHQPWPRVYRGCGDDGIVLAPPGSRLICSMPAVFIRTAVHQMISLEV